jgi:MtN3 and saliva related transmembrane protein
MDVVMIIGIIASVLTASSFLPQLFKLLKEKKAENVSVLMLVVLFSGIVLWICYGALKKDIIIILANLVSLVINVITLVLTVKYKKEKVEN